MRNAAAVAALAAAAGLIGFYPVAARAEPSTAASSTLAPPAADALARPLHLVDDPGTIYAPLEPPRPNTGVNRGGLHLSLTVSYLTDYVYRGIDRSEVGGIDPAETAGGKRVEEDAPNLQFDGQLTFDLGKLPHPFVGVFVNVFDDDPISRFQEVRPYFGLEWTIKPLTLTAGWQTYIFPERDDFNTAEAFAKVQVDDSILFGTDRPILSPYVYGAYDHDLYDGFYVEAGVKHDFPIEDTGIVLTAVADVAFVAGNGAFTRRGNDDTGFQHYDVGLVGSYSLNTVLNVSRRYGEYKLKGYLFYTDGLADNLRADTQLWGGVGLTLEY
jgi:hypothetical protein